MIQEAHGEELNIGEMVMHHTADAWTIDLEPFTTIHLPRWPDVHLGPLTVNLSPTKHVVFMLLAATLVFLTMRIGARAIERRHREGKAPKGFGNAVEALVLYVRNEIAIANIGHDGAKFAPLILTLFFFVLYATLLGLLPWGSSSGFSACTRGPGNATTWALSWCRPRAAIFRARASGMCATATCRSNASRRCRGRRARLSGATTTS